MNITLDLGRDSYDIVIEDNAIGRAGELLDLDRRVLIVTDSGVPEAYAMSVANQCACGHVFTFPHGEEHKTLETYERILEAMLAHSLTRGDCVVAVGGGVCGDISGFAAACYMRGIDFYNIPTTLLSQVDSSIGGKTAVDFMGVKNIVGAFYQPKKVMIDPTVLKTLDKRQIGAGLSEAIKMAATCDKDLFELIEESDDLERDISKIIYGALMIKKEVVEKDPKEKGLRKVLNFGHTIGHAIEAFYNGKYLHGECVALGMLPMCGSEARERIEHVLIKYDLPVKCSATADVLMPYVMHDKKMKDGKISMVYVPKIGSFEMTEADPLQIRKLIQDNY